MLRRIILGQRDHEINIEHQKYSLINYQMRRFNGDILNLSVTFVHNHRHSRLSLLEISVGL